MALVVPELCHVPESQSLGLSDSESESEMGSQDSGPEAARLSAMQARRAAVLAGVVAVAVAVQAVSRRPQSRVAVAALGSRGGWDRPRRGQKPLATACPTSGNGLSHEPPQPPQPRSGAARLSPILLVAAGLLETHSRAAGRCHQPHNTAELARPSAERIQRVRHEVSDTSTNTAQSLRKRPPP